MPTAEELALETKKRYAATVLDDVMIPTLEIRHPAILDEEGDPTAIRIVNDMGTLIGTVDELDMFGWQLGLEADAPLDAGETVTFVYCPFEYIPPSQTDDAIQAGKLRIDNVARQISQYIDDLMLTQADLTITYREYWLTELTTPSTVLTQTAQSINVTDQAVELVANYGDIVNRNFPSVVYQPSQFRGLTQT
jgi:hypothetical protein